MTPPDTAPEAPALPSQEPAEPPAPDVLRDLHRFHLAPPESAAAGLGVLPALLHDRRDEAEVGGYPLFLGPREAGEPASCVALPDLLSRATPEGEATAVLRDRLGELARHVRRAASSRRQPQDARALLAAAGRALAEEAGEDPELLRAGLDRLLAAVPEGGRFVPFSAQAPLHLLMHAARSRLEPARSAFRAEVRSLVAEAEALLAADRLKRPESRRSDAIAPTLGELGSRYVDPSGLSDVLAAGRGGTPLSARRRRRLEAALAALREHLASDPPAVILVHDGLHGFPGCESLESGSGEGDAGKPAARPADSWRVELREDPCAAAGELFDREAEAVARTLRAVRRVRLEAEGKYDPARQDPWIDRFDWQAFSREELLLAPPVVALVTADRVAGQGMVSLSSLLLSGRPVQVLVPVAPAANPGAEGAEPLTGYRFEPAYLALAHREALVQQTSTTEPAHLMRGFLRALDATHAGLHVIAYGACADGAEAPLGAATQAAAAIEARAHPLFHYDPEAGPSWAERLDFSHNPQPEEDWPLYPPAASSGDDDEVLPFTFADFALLEPSYARHFLPVPEGVPEEELVPLAEAVRRPLDGEVAAVPYVWGVDGSSRRIRLAVSRPLALACRDRLSFWRTLQELAGVRSEYVRRAEARSRRETEALASAERERLEARHAAELERLRADAARDVVDRLTAALLEVDVAAFAGPSPANGLLSRLPGSSVDDVAAALLRLVDPSTLGAEPAADAGGEVDKVASELLELVAEPEERSEG